MNNYVNIRSLGAKGDGVSDDSAVFNSAMRDNGYIYIPEGLYMIGETLKISAHTHIVASALSHIKLMAGAQKGRYDFLLTNDGEGDISIDGGIWDGNCAENDRGDDLFNPQATTGTMFNFRGINGLTLTNLVLKNPLCYYMRFCEAENVRLENIRYDTACIVGNQDGVHFAGFCKNFIIRNLWGKYGSPNDDFLAFNADDCLTRQENFDVINGPIDNVLVENVYSEKCHCFVRLLCVESAISNITIRNVAGDCISTAVNLDGARDCRVPLFNNEDKPNGVGNIENVLIENMCVSHNANPQNPFITLETNCKSLTLRNFTGLNEESPFAVVKNTCAHSISLQEKTTSLECGECVTVNGNKLPLFEFRKTE